MKNIQFAIISLSFLTLWSCTMTGDPDAGGFFNYSKDLAGQRTAKLTQERTGLSTEMNRSLKTQRKLTHEKQIASSEVSKLRKQLKVKKLKIEGLKKEITDIKGSEQVDLVALKAKQNQVEFEDKEYRAINERLKLYTR